MKVSKLAVRTYTPEKQQPTDMGTNSPLNMALRPYPTSVPLAGQAQRERYIQVTHVTQHYIAPIGGA